MRLLGLVLLIGCPKSTPTAAVEAQPPATPSVADREPERAVEMTLEATQLPEPVEIDPGNFSDEERKEHGVAILPTNLGSALSAFSADAVLRRAMGEELARVFAAVRKSEMEHMQNMSLDEERGVLLERY